MAKVCLVTFSISLLMPLSASAEPWLQFCKSEFECGYKTASDKVMIEPIYKFDVFEPYVITEDMRLKDEIRLEFSRNGLIGFMNTKGEVIVSPTYSNAGPLNWRHEYQIVELNGKKSVLKKDGTQSILRADQIVLLPSNETTLRVKRNKRWQITDFNGTALNNDYYDNFGATSRANQYLTYIKNKKYGLVGFNGSEILPAEYTHIAIEELPFLVVTKNRKRALFDSLGNQLTDFIYDHMLLPIGGDTTNNAIAVTKDGRAGLIDFNGEPLSDFQLDAPKSTGRSYSDKQKLSRLSFSEGLGGYFEDGKFGYINRAGNIVIPHDRFVSGNRFRNGLAKIKLTNGKHAIINQDGRILVEGTQKEIRYATLGNHLRFYKKGKTGLMTRSGDILIKAKKDSIGIIYDGQYVSYYNGYTKGLVSFDDTILNNKNTMKEIIPEIFEGVTVKDGFIFVSFGDQFHPMKINGTPIGFSIKDVPKVWKKWCSENTTDYSKKFCSK